MQQVIDFINAAWGPLLAVAVSTGLISVLVQKFKKWFSVQSPRVAWFLGLLFTGLGVGFQMLLSSDPNTWGVLRDNLTLAMTVLQPVYLFVIKPATQVIHEVEESRTAKVAVATEAVEVTPVATVEAVTPVPQSEFGE